MARFEKGTKPGPGRPKGLKNKSYLDGSHWLERADQEVQEEENPDKRMAIIRWAAELIMQKVQILPATPGDSVNNASAQQALLLALERDALEPQPDAAGG